jgi:uncharacterized membrane protein YesL
MKRKMVMSNEEKVFDLSPDEKYVDTRGRIAVFFDVLTGKFWRLIPINFLYILFNIPAILVSIFFSTYIMELFLPGAENATTQDISMRFIMQGLPFALLFMVIPAICIGPAQAGMTYLLRCFSYELPTFTWSDFRDKMRENLKQGFIASILNILIAAFLIIDIYFYSKINLGSEFFTVVSSAIIFLAVVIFLMMNFYIYPMMVVYDLKLKHIYKNAFLFAFAKFLPNLLLMVICYLLVIGPIILVEISRSSLLLSIAYAYYIILGFSLPGLIVNFYVNPVIDKYLRPAANENNENKG